MARAGSSSRLASDDLRTSLNNLSSSQNSSFPSVSASSSTSSMIRLHPSNSGATVASPVRKHLASGATRNPRNPKLSIPRPLNLPSRQSEHAVNDSSVSLVGRSGSSGWSKKKLPACPGDSPVTSRKLSVDTSSGGSASIVKESISSATVLQTETEKGIMEVGVSLCQNEAPSYGARSSSCITAFSRNPNGSFDALQSVERSMVLEGEDFPTLQAAVCPVPTHPAQQKRQVKQRHNDMEHERMDQPMQPQRLLALRANLTMFGKPYNVDEHCSDNVVHSSNSRTDKLNGPAPLICVDNTSNWVDDEREILQSMYGQNPKKSVDSGALKYWNGSQLSGGRATNPKAGSDVGQPTLHSSAYGKTMGDVRDCYSISEGQSMHGMDSNKGFVKSFSTQKLNEQSWEDTSRESGKAVKLGRDIDLREGSNRLGIGCRKAGLDDQQGYRSRKNLGIHEYGRFQSSGAGHTLVNKGSDLPGLSYGKEKDRRKSTLNGQDPFTDEPTSLNLGWLREFEASVGFSGLKARSSKRSKDEPPTFHDPARELFEAELERVQKMQEEERQRQADEHRKALELARIEEECKRLAREEELLYLKSEEQAREAAAQGQTEEEEAAQRTYELHRIRLEEKHAFITEQERRKEAARRKLVELEERIALRDSKQNLTFGSSTMITNAISQGDNGTVQSVAKFDQDDYAFSKGIQQTQDHDWKDHARGSHFLPVKSSTGQPCNSKVGKAFLQERKRIVHINKEDKGNATQETQSAMKSYQYRADPPCESLAKSFSVQESSMESIRSLSLDGSQSSLTVDGQDFPSRRDNSHFINDERIPPTEMNMCYTDFGIERNNGVWLDRGSPHLHEFVLDSSSGCPIWPLTKQAIVPRLAIGHPNLQREKRSIWAVPCVSDRNNTNNHCREDNNCSGQEVIWGGLTENSDCAGIETSQAVPSTMIEMVKPMNNGRKVFDEIAGDLKSALEFCNNGASQSDNIDRYSECLGDLEEFEQPREVDKNFAVDIQAHKSIFYAGKDELSVVETLEDVGEELCYKGQQIEEITGHELVDQESNKSKKISGDTGNTPFYGIEQERLEDSIQENWNMIDGSRGTEDEDGGMESKRDGHLMDATRITDSGSGHSGDEAHNLPYVQQFQEPFSLMAVPLPQSITVDGVTLHPPMFSPVSNHQTQQDSTYQLETGLVPSDSLMSNTSHIGCGKRSVQEQSHIPSAIHQHEQLPVFQFGQLWHLDQPVHHIQSTFETCHPMGQPLSAQQHKDDLLLSNRNV
ncbi:hypothetical protein KP509_30G074300 [Ceratopteris richardii]|uniref:Uncharacterized protein n=1 Tax=Ceratopteris richardii TaxID=49495 RepID=A0A8T2R617_CERRI|nr:hypothetical protein KP509_30G074300 [Ceratopteris richardii]KAH7291035.1 hypothetical protein KP509_30G074300 [Ceratopteris richardii]